MTTGTLRTQGSELFFVDALSSSVAAVLKLACPTGITGVNAGARDQLEDTCLDNTVDKTYKGGLGNPGQISVPFNFIPSNASHQILFDLKESGDVIEWMVGFSDGSAVPTLDSDDKMIPPAAPLRTTIGFDAFVSDVAIDVATNEIVRGTLTLQRSGAVRPHWNGPIPT
ncbi:phage tail tube protein [Lysobacter enzymogenes]|uniref:phage tail tube protein n=1 Tax=Lysobacter enzymogenes TaxID=69 RepID=UPI00089610A9|nr:phage tail tube protein [Lysobacter enzymogenes]SDW95046.1 Phage tail tube, TTP, lambda-like [Lysobacter enzymogenes]